MTVCVYEELINAKAANGDIIIKYKNGKEETIRFL